jgi:transposase
MAEVKGVRTFLGVDAHPEHCTLRGVSRQGRSVLEVDVPTVVAELRAAVKGLPRPAWAMLEATAVAPLVKWALEPVVDRVIVCETRENRWISQSEDASDPRDADRLARLLRMGEFKEVYVPQRERQELRELARLYDRTVKDGTRLKNRIKAKYREQGVMVSGKNVYDPQGREAWQKQVTRSTVRLMLEVLYAELDAVQEAGDRLARRLAAMLRNRRDYRRLLGIPGIGPVTAAIMVVVIDDPHRFANQRKLWKYAGLSVSKPWTSRPENAKEWGSRSGNRLLKHGAMMAARHALQGTNRFAAHYTQMVERGLDPAMAERTIARRILATVLAVWKSGTEYREQLQGA